MKHVRQPTDPHRKRRYNLCHRLRAKGIEVNEKAHAIMVSGDDEFQALSPTAARYVEALRQDYRYVVQYQIGPAVPLKFNRKKKA